MVHNLVMQWVKAHERLFKSQAALVAAVCSPRELCGFVRSAKQRAIASKIFSHSPISINANNLIFIMLFPYLTSPITRVLMLLSLSVETNLLVYKKYLI